MMQQYMGFKRQYPDKILLFRMGDFYETFGEDAKLAAKVLNITLTSRDKTNDPTPLAGFPHHALQQYLPKIISAGYCAVVVDQIEDPKLAQGVVKRGVTRVVTPGTLDGELANDSKNSYVLAISASGKRLGLALVDLSTGAFKVSEMSVSQDNVDSVINSFDPSEVLAVDGDKKFNVENLPVQLIETSLVKGNKSSSIVTEFYNAKSLDSLGLENISEGTRAIAMALLYVQDTQKMDPVHIERPTQFSLDGSMILDRATIRNLDLVANSYTGAVSSSLIEKLDNTKTRMGKRILYSWILNPLLDIKQIESRLSVVEILLNDFDLLTQLRSLLSEVSDVERIVGKIGLNRANARDLNALSYSLSKSKDVVEILSVNKGLESEFPQLGNLFSGENSLLALIKMLDESINPNPPLTITEGNIIKDGYDAKVDEYRGVSGNSKTWVEEFIQEEKNKTGISSMKIGFNRVFGYYIEVSKAHSGKVPDTYIRKQTLVNSERYITEELKQKEDIILGAEDKLSSLEYEIFQKIRLEVIPYLEKIKLLSHEIARLDILAGFAFVSRNSTYVRPTLYERGESDGILSIKNGRHPVVEALTDDDFISNDTEISSAGRRMCVITGPNMSGKSTYIRQVALIALMAQIGCFVPADSAEISLVDRVFSRVGAADNLSQGRSTFMVEMEEAANILNNATESSLIILDEVGRGTSTYDGVSIAWSLAEYLVDHIKARTLFATHYHELLELQKNHPEFVQNYNVQVVEDLENDEVVFLRKIIEGGTDRSYGIYVAKMAGLPEQVTTRATEILEGFRSVREQSVGKNSVYSEAQSDFQPDLGPKQNFKKAKSETNSELQFSFFDAAESEIRNELQKLDLENMTPIEALQKLLELKKKSLDS